jgi:D-serine deaminase-like pyridoxal phosphate-dependent protein
LSPFPELDTPVALVDLDRVAANLARAQAYADAHGFHLRPHVKTHKLPVLARQQVELGAVGITCQKLGEAEAMADGGLADILLTYNILGERKLDRLAALHGRVRMSVVADNVETVHGYAARFTDPARLLTVLVECDTGAGRCGVQSPEEALALARAIATMPGLRFGGLMTYPPKLLEAEVEAWLASAVRLLTREGLPPPVVSSGGSPGFYRAAEIRAATEQRPGTYIYSDRMQVGWGHGTLDNCALTVLATVVSRPTLDRAVIDAGSKALAADTAPLPGFGHVVDYPEALITSLSEEHGVLNLSSCSRRPKIGDRVRVVPNHACVVSNLFDVVHLTRGDRVVSTEAVTSRGRMT